MLDTLRLPDLFVVTLLVIFFFNRGLLDKFLEGINHFRGGPPTPKHPSPAGDVALLKKVEI